MSGPHNSNPKSNKENKLKKVTVNEILNMKLRNEKISVLTAYDYCSALICDRAGVDILLVGDSLGMVVLGYEDTISVEMDDMILFSKAVSRGVSRSMIITDMPFGSYQINSNDAVINAINLIKAGSNAVKLEGGIEIVETIKHIVKTGIPVMGHIGLKPQTSTLWEGYKIQGKTKESALKLIHEAQELEKAGVFCIVLEMVTHEVADLISKRITIPTIGIGSGPSCDGQVLVLHDMLGIYERLKPRFVKKYTNLSEIIESSTSKYVHEVKHSIFPNLDEHSFHMDKEEYSDLMDVLNKSIK